MDRNLSRRDALKAGAAAGLLATVPWPATAALDDSLRFDQVSFKGSHNSYQRDEDVHVTLDWDSNAKYQGGCRGVEFDFTRHSDSSKGRSAGYFQVTHNRGGSGPPLASYLGYLLSWHLKTPKHDVITVTLDIKSESGDATVFPDEIDAYLTQWFDESTIYRPHDLTNGDDLVAHVKAKGWPTLQALQGKFLFVLSGYDGWKSYYASKDRAKRLCFADVDVSDKDKNLTPPTSGDRAIYNFNLHTDTKTTWSAVVPQFRAARCLVRGYVLNGEDLWKAARSAGVNMMATDEIRNKTWAAVGDSPFVRTLNT